MLSSLEKVIFALVIFITLGAFAFPLFYRYRILRAGRPDARFDGLGKRVWEALGKVLFQKCTLKNERLFTGFMHVFIFYSALTFDTMTINHSLEGFFDGFYLFGRTNLGLFFSLLVDVMAILVLVGVLFFIIRRFIVRPKAYATTPLDSAIIYSLIIIVTLTYLYFEAFAIANHPETARLSFLGNFLSRSLLNSSLGAAALSAHFRISWWLHILVVFGFIAYVPHSKYFHMFTGPLNVLFRRSTPSGELNPLDLEKSEVFGVEKALDWTWKDTLDAFACMECGRCQDVCPAATSEKPLSPKMILFNLEKNLLRDGKTLVARKRDELSALVPSVFSEGEIWTCTTCGACMHVCPVEIEHIPKIVGLRQSQVLMESKFPSQLNAFFKNMETNSNPWGIGFAARGDWREGLDIKLIKDHPQAEYLFWVGCLGSFDDEGKKVARAMAAILNRAEVDFAILGTEEKCCGDSARRLGNEYLFQTLAGENISLFRSYGVKKIITICPHGYNTFKNEYPRLLDLNPAASAEEKDFFKKLEIIPHVQLLDRLLRDGRLSLKKRLPGSITYHDSCYLGRHNGIIEQPREILSKLAENKITEMSNSREHSFCCGAGGGLMWTEESLGKRINHLRTDEVIQSQVSTAATSCPFCQTMLRDGLKDKERTDIRVKDIAELLVEAL
jgi:Fe-S oxidoreductase/nitrate reductase gamma subunit